MLKKTYSLPIRNSLKRLVKYGKTLLASNLVFAALALPLNSLQTPVNNNLSGLIIPEQKLDLAFNIEAKAPTDEAQFPVEYSYISQYFNRFHPALDLVTKYGTAIRPLKSGTVTFAGFSASGYGNEILIDHGNGEESLYAHLSKIKVKIGDSVTKTDIIGLVGVTGHSTGPHLHFEIHEKGSAVNPLTVLPKATQSNLTASISL